MEPQSREIEYYETASGKYPFRDWLAGLKDRQGQARVNARITRLRSGQKGNWKSVGGGVFELKEKFGPGYRIYFSEKGKQIILLLCGGDGGDKGNQKLDIETAKRYWVDHQLQQQKGQSDGR